MFDLANVTMVDVVAVVAGVLAVASIVAKWTPTKADDSFVQMLYNIVHTLGLTKKVENKEDVE